MLDHVEYERWMAAARATLNSAHGDLERGDYNWACFKAQQAGELAVKALLHGIGAPRAGHSITLLLERLRETGLEPPGNIVECAQLLDKMYIPTRYPDAWSEGPPHIYYNRGDAGEAISCAARIIQWVDGLWRRYSKGGGVRGQG